MRRLAGAALLIGVLGGANLVGSLRTPDAGDASSVVSVVGTADSTVDVAPPPRTSIASLDDPLHFLSTAPPESLDLLPGIGPVLADRLVAARERDGAFASWDDVDRVPGIGPKTIERLRTLAPAP